MNPKMNPQTGSLSTTMFFPDFIKLIRILIGITKYFQLFWPPNFNSFLTTLFFPYPAFCHPEIFFAVNSKYT